MIRFPWQPKYSDGFLTDEEDECLGYVAYSSEPTITAASEAAPTLENKWLRAFLQGQLFFLCSTNSDSKYYAGLDKTLIKAHFLRSE